jgi:glycosyltransferase involved in cell wall biosynthesis
MSPTVLIFRTDLLPLSETFIAAQARALRRYTPTFAGLRRVPNGLQIDPSELVTLTAANSLADKIRRRLFLHTGIAPKLLRNLRRIRPALLHAHFAVDAAAALPLQRRLDAPLIVTLHGYDVTTKSELLRRSAPGNAYLRRKSELHARATLFLCVSDHLRRHALDRGFPANKLRTLPIGVDLDLFAPDPLQSRSRDPIVLFIGRLVSVKGCAHLIRAMAHVHKHHPDAKLLIVGDGPLLNPLRALAGDTFHRSAPFPATRLDGAKCVFLAWQPPHIVRDLLRRASLLVAPSVVTSEGHSEALNMAVCEAQAMAVPVVGFRGTGVEEAVADGETALLAPAGDESMLADCISAIISDPVHAARLGAAGRRRAELHFSLAAQTALLENLYDEVLQ